MKARIMKKDLKLDRGIVEPMVRTKKIFFND